MKIPYYYYSYMALGAFIIIVIVSVCYSKFSQEPKIKQRVDELYLNGKFATGTIKYKGYTTYELGNILMDIGYWFEVQNNTQRGSITRIVAEQISKATYSIFLKSTGRWEGAAKDAQFLVLYDENDLGNSIILFECPINSDSDIVRYVAEIEELRKDPEWRGYR